MGRWGHAWLWGLCAALTSACAGPDAPSGLTFQNITQADINARRLTPGRLFSIGEVGFDALFSCTQGGGAIRDGRCVYDRVNGPEAQSCLECHNSPISDGAGTLTSNVFRWPDAATGRYIERNPPHLFGVGYVELLAREMTADLQRQRDGALAAARVGGHDVTVALATKGLDFGQLRASPDGNAEYLGTAVQADLVVRPFMAKGLAATIRDQNLGAITGHLGIQPTEVVGAGQDPDQDGFTDEMTVGQVSAVVAYQALLPLPSYVPVSAHAAAGAQVFVDVGCADCHTPTLRLEQASYFVADPAGGGQGMVLDLPQDGMPPRGVRLGVVGPVLVPLFSDLRRHDVGAALADYRDVPILAGPLDPQPPLGSPLLATLPSVPAAHFVTSRLWGVGSTAPYLHHGHAIDLAQAILAHGGEGAVSRQAYQGLDASQQLQLLDYLRSLILVRSAGTTGGTAHEGAS